MWTEVSASLHGLLPERAGSRCYNFFESKNMCLSSTRTMSLDLAVLQALQRLVVELENRWDSLLESNSMFHGGALSVHH